MATVISKIDELTATVKSELADFLANQKTLLGLRDGLSSMRETKPDVYNKLNDQFNSLYSKQQTLEQSAMDWVKKVTDLKSRMTDDPQIAAALSGQGLGADLFDGSFWQKVTALTNSSLPLINQGLLLSSQLVTQNGDVALLKQSVEAGAVLVPTNNTLWSGAAAGWIYGLAGIGIAYFLAKRKKRK